MADYIRNQEQGVPAQMKTRYRDMGDDTHALIISAVIPAQESDDITGGLVTIDNVHHEIHEGEFFSISYKVPDDSPIADNATLSFGITTGTAYTHFQGSGSCGGDAEIEFYEGSSISGGTAMTPLNHKRYSANTSGATVVRDPTINTAGTILENVFLPGGSGPRAVGATGDQRQEWILKASTVYTLRLTNRSGSTQSAYLKMAWYEEGNG